MSYKCSKINDNEKHPDMLKYLFHLRHLLNIHSRTNLYPNYDKKGKIITSMKQSHNHHHDKNKSNDCISNNENIAQRNDSILLTQLNKSHDYHEQVELCKRLEQDKLMKYLEKISYDNSNNGYDNNIKKKNNGISCKFQSQNKKYKKIIIPTTTSAKIKTVPKIYFPSKVKPFRFSNKL